MAPTLRPDSSLLAIALHGQAPATPYALSGLFCHLQRRLPDYKDPASRQVNMCRRIQKVDLQPIIKPPHSLVFLGRPRWLLSFALQPTAFINSKPSEDLTVPHFSI